MLGISVPLIKQLVDESLAPVVERLDRVVELLEDEAFARTGNRRGVG